MSEAGGRLGRRLRRILLLLPYAIRHPGVTVDELARKFDVRKSDLIADLQLVFLCGLPGYGPGDLIEVDVDDEDRVFVRMADYFSSPLRLTASEALALYAGGAAIAGLPGMEEAEALKRALSKLAKALGMGDGAGVEVNVEAGDSEHLGLLQRALTERRRVRMEYYSASRAELTHRQVDPWGLVAALGHWYLVALDHSSGEERMFRTDRIKSLELTSEPAAVPSDFDPERYRGAFRGAGPVKLSLDISPGAARWFEDYYPVAASEELSDGWRRVRLIAGSERWAAILVLRLAQDVRNVEPASVMEEAGRLAALIVERHEP